MRWHLAWLAAPVLALACFVGSPDTSFAHGGGGGGGHGGGGHAGGYGGYGGHGYYGGGYGRGYGGYGYGVGWGYGGLGYGGWGYGGYGLGYGGYGLGYGGYGGGYYSPYNYSTPYVNGPAYYSAPVYSQPYAATPAGTTYQSFYPNTMATQQAPSDRALIKIEVPDNAQVLFNNTPTTQTGPERTFVTPPLTANENSSYEVTAQWSQNGQPRRESRTVQVAPGQTVDVNFLTKAVSGSDGR